MRKVLLGSFLVLLLFGVSSVCRAQGGVGELTGVILDPTGAVVADAKVTLSNSATGFERVMQSTSAGVYRFSDLPVVSGYALAVEHSGFRLANVSKIAISVGTIATIDVHLEVGVQSESIVVEAGAEQISASESQISELVDRTVWQNLPLEIRNQNSFINLVAGVAPNDVTGTTRGAAVNGARPGMGNFMLEGYDNNDQGQAGRGAEGQGAVTSISPEAIEEYRVITHSYQADYGKGGGFVTDTVLKSGTNSLHGSLFEYNRIQALAANDFFSNAAGLKDHLVRNQFGGSLGGPILKNKWYFYGSYEGHRRASSTPISTFGVTPGFLNFVKSGAFETFQETNAEGFCMQSFGATCPGAFSQSATLGPTFSKLMSTQPFPLAPTTPACTSGSSNPCIAQGFYTTGICPASSPNACATPGQLVNVVYPMSEFGPLTVSDGDTFYQHRVSFKSDYKFSDNDSLSGTFLYTTDQRTNEFNGGDSSIGPSSITNQVEVLFGLTWTHSFSANLLNQFRASYLRHRLDFPNPPGTAGVPDILSALDSLGVGFGNASALPQFFTDNLFQYKDDMTLVHGKHTFKYGGEYRRTRNGSSFQSQKNGLFFFYSTEELLTDGLFGDVADQLVNGGTALGSMFEASASVNPLTGAHPEYYRGYRANEYAFYFLDDWKITPRLTLNPGLRYEYFGPPHNFKPGIDSNIFFGSPLTPIPLPFPPCTPTTSTSKCNNPFLPVNNPLAAAEAGARAIQVNQNIWAKDTNNFAPRLGLAWDVMGNQKLVFRAGGGFFYDRIYNNVFENIRFNPPFFAFATLGALLGLPPAGSIATPGLYADPFTNTQGFLAFAAKPGGRHMDQNLETPYTQQANVGVQYAMAKDFVLEVDGAYTGGRKLMGVYDANTFDGRIACTSATSPRAVCKAAFAAGEIPSVSFTSARLNSTLASDNLRTNAFASTYYGLLVSVIKHFGNGLQFNSNYTWSHAIDDLSDAFNGGHGVITSPTNPQNIALDKGNADFDIRHRFVTSFYYELPFLKQNRWLGGWSTDGIVSIQRGVPVPTYTGTISTNRDGAVNPFGNFIDRPAINGNPYLGKNPADGFLNPAAFSAYVCPASVNFGLWCNSPTGRNTLIGPGFVNTDFGVGKKFRIRETMALQFQANFFNLFNHPNFDIPVGNVLGNSAQFGKSIADINGARVTQLALRLDF
jgi:Carboxypeptidase regulatory-like domain/TonB dependent receptor